MKTLSVLMLSLIISGSVLAQSSKIPAELVGKWFEGSTSILQEQNTVTGAVGVAVRQFDRLHIRTRRQLPVCGLDQIDYVRLHDEPME